MAADSQQNITISESIPKGYCGLNSVRIPCTKNVSGAWTNNGRYWNTTHDEDSLNDDKRVFHLLHVCWLDYKCSNQIRNGKYACFWRVKLKDLFWKGNWKIGVDAGEFDMTDPPTGLYESYTNDGKVIHYAHTNNGGILKGYCNTGKFYYIYFGDIALQSKEFVNNLQFSLSQNNPYGVDGISFDCVELYEIESPDISWINELALNLNLPAAMLNLVLHFSGFFSILYD